MEVFPWSPEALQINDGTGTALSVIEKFLNRKGFVFVAEMF